MARDGMILLEAVYSHDSPHWLRELSAIQNLRQKWLHQFYVIEGELRMRDPKDLPSASLRFNSPYDPVSTLPMIQKLITAPRVVPHGMDTRFI
jgi:hypothetical protein